MESIMASDSSAHPYRGYTDRPFWNPFSITIPAPSRTAPDLFINSISPISASIGKEIIDQKNMVFRSEEFFGKDYIIYFFMCKGFHFGAVHFPVKIQTLRLFGKNNRYIEILSCDAGNADARGSMVRIFVIGQSEKRLLNSFPISLIRVISIW